MRKYDRCHRRVAVQSGFSRFGFLVPVWVVITCQSTLVVGGWLIVHTMGVKITRLNPMQAFVPKPPLP